jgi:hypothetical protein
MWLEAIMFSFNRRAVKEANISVRISSLREKITQTSYNGLKPKSTNFL